ncbi:hypothetical protein GCM10023165_34260 [Variovorax defluvii]|uniref:Tetratricopeptide repeat protein n=1 Tax=Variovorax defluvii TaxID=913761 RepID=A0ABP8HZZ6_9BURK
MPDPTADLETMVQDLQARVQAMMQRLSDPQINGIYVTACNLLRLGHADRAAPMLSTLTVFRPERVQFWHALGLCHRRLDEFAPAAAAFGRAFALAPAFLDCGLMQVEALLLQGLRAEATRLLDEVGSMARAQNDAAAMLRADGLRELIEGPSTCPMPITNSH